MDLVDLKFVFDSYNKLTLVDLKGGLHPLDPSKVDSPYFQIVCSYFIGMCQTQNLDHLC